MECQHLENNKVYVSLIVSNFVLWYSDVAKWSVGLFLDTLLNLKMSCWKSQINHELVLFQFTEQYLNTETTNSSRQEHSFCHLWYPH